MNRSNDRIGRLKARIKERFPFLVYIWRWAPLVMKSRNQIFDEIYRENKWGDPDSASGTGSNLTESKAIRGVLPGLLKELNCRSLLDVPCGDFFWMKMVEMDVYYIGGDIVVDLVANNQEKYGSDRRVFRHMDIINDSLPKADLVLCRDGFVHFSHADIFRALKNIKAVGSTYLLTTTFDRRERNEDIPTGSWRPLNLQSPPFCLPAPLRLIDEECPNPGYRDKKLGLWKIADIPLAVSN